VASGPLHDLTSDRVRGWEVVAAVPDDALRGRLTMRASHARELTPGRYRFELAADATPAPFIAELAAGGAALVSVNPLRTTLEDVFVQAVATDREAP
jgi:hypothetical protein